MPRKPIKNKFRIPILKRYAMLSKDVIHFASDIPGTCVVDVIHRFSM